MVKYIAATTKKINSAHILRVGRPWCKTNHDILRLAEYQFFTRKSVITEFILTTNIKTYVFEQFKSIYFLKSS